MHLIALTSGIKTKGRKKSKVESWSEKVSGRLQLFIPPESQSPERFDDMLDFYWYVYDGRLLKHVIRQTGNLALPGNWQLVYMWIIYNETYM